jgi:hypothetical protein
MTIAKTKSRVRCRAAAALPSRHAELLILCARIGFNP